MLILDESTETPAALRSPSARQRREVIRSALSIVIAYALFGALWILLSDRLLIWLVAPSELPFWQSLKGLLYISLTATLLFLLVRAQLLRIASALRTSRDSELRFRRMLQLARVALIELDSSEVMQLIQEWRKEGITDFPSACREQPLLLAQLISRLRIVGANPEALSMFDMASGNALSHLPAKLFPVSAAPILLALLEAIRDRKSRFSAELKLLAQDGSRRELLLDAGMPAAEDDARVIISLTDAAASSRARARHQLLQHLSTEVASAPDLESALQLTVRRLCEVGEWQLGQLWQPSPEGDVLVCRELFHTVMPELESFTEKSREFAFRKGRGLPGRVWQQRASIWLRDVSLDSNFPRAALATQVDLRSAVALPLFRDDVVVGVLEFFCQSMRREEPDLVDIMSSTLAQLELVFNAKQQSDALRRVERQFRQSMDAVGFGFWEWDVASGRVQWLGNVERMFGLSSGGFDGRMESYLALLPSDDRLAIEAAIASALAGESVDFRVQHRIRLGDGQYRWLEGRGHVIRDQDETPVTMAGTVADITELQLDARLLPQLAAATREGDQLNRRRRLLGLMGDALGADDVLLLQPEAEAADVTIESLFQVALWWQPGDSASIGTKHQFSSSFVQTMLDNVALHLSALRQRYPEELLFLQRESQSCLFSWLQSGDHRRGVVVLLFRRELAHPEHLLALLQLVTPHLSISKAGQ